MKKITKKCRVLLVAVLSLTMLVGATMTTNAANASVTFTVEASDVNAAITVPTTIPIIFNADGTNTYPTNWKITNSGEYASIYLSSVSASMITSAWRLLGELDEMKDVESDTLKVKFYMGVSGNMEQMIPDSTGQGHINYSRFDMIEIPAGESTTLEFEVERGAFTEARDEAVAMELTLNFAFV